MSPDRTHDVRTLVSILRIADRGDSSGFVDPIVFEIPGQPEAWQRTGGSGKRRFTRPKTAAAEEAIGWLVNAQLPVGWISAGNFSLAAVFYRRNRQSVDADNLLKLLKDGLTRSGLWGDDRQCTFASSLVDVDADCPRTLFVIGRHGGTKMIR